MAWQPYADLPTMDGLKYSIILYDEGNCGCKGSYTLTPAESKELGDNVNCSKSRVIGGIKYHAIRYDEQSLHLKQGPSYIITIVSPSKRMRAHLCYEGTQVLYSDWETKILKAFESY